MRLLLVCPVFLAFIFMTQVVEADLVAEIRELDPLRLRESPAGCPAVGIGGQCPGSNPIFHFKCCGDRNTVCCFRLQDWLTVLFAIIIVLIIFAIIINFIRCIFCF